MAPPPLRIYPPPAPEPALPDMLKRELAGVLTPSELDMLYSAFDQVGGIIIVRIPDPLLPKKKLIGQTLLDKVKPARSVFVQSSPVGGDHRTRSLELLAGQDSTLTEHKENGYRMIVDVEKAFFSPRLSTERMRVAEACADGETVLNMFGGIGAFSLAIAARKLCTIYNIDINPEATRLCGMNASRNRLKGRIISITGDAATEAIKLKNTSNRTLMVLPERSSEFLPAALEATAKGGVIHYYAHTHSHKRAGAAQAAAEGFASACPAKFEVLNAKNVRAVGPGYHQTVVDARIL